MQMKDYYYHSINIVNKKIDNKNEIYEIFRNILKKGLLSKKLSGFRRDIITLNGEEYISLAKYIPYTKYKVPVMSLNEFKESNMSRLFKSYNEYKKYIEQDRYLSTPMTMNEFFLKNGTNNKRDYYKYSDTIARLFPIDLKWLFNNEIKNDEILNTIYRESTKESEFEDIGYYFSNENAFELVILNNTSIIFVISNKIRSEKMILIPNLPEDFFNKEMELKIANSKNKRYSNLIGEVQVKDKIELADIKGIILSDNINHKIIKNIMEELNIKIPLLKFNLEKEILEEE